MFSPFHRLQVSSTEVWEQGSPVLARGTLPVFRSVHLAWPDSVMAAHLCQLWRLDLFDLEKVTNREEGDGHGADADHENDQRWTVGDVAPQVLHRI